MKRSAPSDQDGSRQTNRRRQQGPSARRDDSAGPQQASASRTSSGRAAGDASRNSAVAQGSSTSQESVSVTYPHPKNFAERLMFCLESRAAPETIWWEDSGRTVALHVDNLKQGDVLTRHFNGIKYKFFIRNFSRWGFRRNLSFTVPFGQFHYSNSLFQRDNPHLIKHMRMDSDVQDVFARHQASENQARRNNGQDTGGDPQATSSTANPSASADRMNSSRNQQETAAQGGAATLNLAHGNQPPPAAMFNPPPQPAPQQAQQVDSLLGALLPGLMPAMQGSAGGIQPSGAQPPSGGLSSSRPEAQQDPNNGMLLQVLLELTQVYLNQPTLQSPYSDAIGAILRIVQVLGQQSSQGRVENQLQQLGQGTTAPPVVEQQANTNNAAPQGSQDMMSLLAQSLAQPPAAIPSRASFQYQDRSQQQQQQLPTMQPQLLDLLRQQPPVPQPQHALPAEGSSSLGLLLQQLMSGGLQQPPPHSGGQQNNNPNNGQGR